MKQRKVGRLRRTRLASMIYQLLSLGSLREKRQRCKGKRKGQSEEEVDQRYTMDNSMLLL